MVDLQRPSTLMQDKRPIKAVYFNVENGGGYQVGANATEIEAYGENGQMDGVPWIAVSDKTGVIVRIPASAVTVYYT